MNAGRVFLIVKKDVKKTIREPALLFLILLFPIMLTLFFGLAFGAVGGGDTSTYKVGVVDLNAQGSSHYWSDDLITDLAATRILVPENFTSAEYALKNLSSGNLQAVLLIPGDFGTSCDSFVINQSSPSSWTNSTLVLYLDKGSLAATQVVPPLIGDTLARMFESAAVIRQLPVTIGIPSLVDAKRQSTFDYMVPGLFSYGAIFFTMTVGQSLASEREEGLLKRMSTTPLTSTEFMTSQAVTNMLLAAAQVGVILAMAFVLGYSPQTDAAGIAMAFLALMVFSLCCVGFGLITATIARSASATTGIAFLFILPQMFLGTFIASGTSGTAAIVGKVVPSHYVTDALTNLFLRGAPITSAGVVLDIEVMTVASIGILLLGMLLWRRFGKA